MIIEEPPATDRTTPRLRFKLRSLLLLMLAFALCLWLGPIAYDRYTSVPLSALVDRFNAVNQDHQIGQHEPAITVDEVLAAIEVQLPSVGKESEHAARVYSKILRSKRAPATTVLDAIPGYSNGVDSWDVWWINLNVALGENAGYGLRIRHSNHPRTIDGGNQGIDLAAPVPPELLAASSSGPDQIAEEPQGSEDER